MAKRKKTEIDIDDMIQEKVDALLEERMAELDALTLELSDMKEEQNEGDFEIVHCGDCRMWEKSPYQEDNSRINGVCHCIPTLPQRKSTDWCAKGVKA